MFDNTPLQDLSEIATIWSMVRQAHGGPGSAVSEAQQGLMERYGGSVYRYLLGALRDRHAADDLFQDFSLRFLRGDFRNANPEKGRFRDFVKTALYHLIVDYQNRRRAGPRPLPEGDSQADPSPPDLVYSEQEFLASWRNEILSRTWESLAAASRTTGQTYYRVLRFRAENPALSSAQMAERLSEELGKAVKPEWVRQTLRRAREKFTELLLDDLARSLDNPSRERLTQELIDLGLHSYCHEALEQRGCS
jgi:RNA polymerase sigma-70 factor (ECF subfamily)